MVHLTIVQLTNQQKEKLSKKQQKLETNSSLCMQHKTCLDFFLFCLNN